MSYSAAVLRAGGTVVVMDRFDAEAYLALVERFRVTHSQLVPTMFVRLLRLAPELRERRELASLRCVLHSAAPCPVEIKEQMLAWWGPVIHEFYGGTEGVGLVSIAPQEWLAHKGSVGREPDDKVKIANDAGDELPPGQVGTVYFAGGREFAYHNDPEKTRQGRNHRGWVTLGDVGYLDADGYLFLTDRLDYTIISGGVNIYPQETENLLITHPQVADAAVFGVPSDEFGEEVVAVVQPLDPALATTAFAEALIAHCRASLSALKCPRLITFEARLPREENGKLYKKVLRQRYLAAR
jgi:acyl-CoA synthetase (AMP-forming)/AMP-acid ligase II